VRRNESIIALLWLAAQISTSASVTTIFKSLFYPSSPFRGTGANKSPASGGTHYNVISFSTYLFFAFLAAFFLGAAFFLATFFFVAMFFEFKMVSKKLIDSKNINFFKLSKLFSTILNRKCGKTDD
jgi:hypothetical protein